MPGIEVGTVVGSSNMLWFVVDEAGCSADTTKTGVGGKVGGAASFVAGAPDTAVAAGSITCELGGCVVGLSTPVAFVPITGGND